MEFDWIVFTDPLNTAASLDESSDAGKDLFELDPVCVLSAGEAIADQLRFRQIHPDLIEPALGIRDALEHILDYLQVENFAEYAVLHTGLSRNSEHAYREKTTRVQKKPGTKARPKEVKIY